MREEKREPKYIDRGAHIALNFVSIVLKCIRRLGSFLRSIFIYHSPSPVVLNINTNEVTRILRS
jgi:hypothetical protein